MPVKFRKLCKNVQVCCSSAISGLAARDADIQYCHTMHCLLLTFYHQLRFAAALERTCPQHVQLLQPTACRISMVDVWRGNLVDGLEGMLLSASRWPPGRCSAGAMFNEFAPRAPLFHMRSARPVLCSLSSAALVFDSSCIESVLRRSPNVCPSILSVPVSQTRLVKAYTAHARFFACRASDIAHQVF